MIVDITAEKANRVDNCEYEETFNEFKKMFKDQSGLNPHLVLNDLQNAHLLAIAPDSNGGLILCKRYHAELVGPGAAVGGLLDIDCTQVILIGNLSLLKLNSYPDSQQAYEIRQQWITYLQDLVKVSDPLVRSQKILYLIDRFFNNPPNIDQLPDHTLAMLAGVLPKTIQQAKKYRQIINPCITDQKIKKKNDYNSFCCNYLQSPIYSPMF